MRKSILSEYLYTFTAHIIVTIFGIIILKIAAGSLTEEGLGAFMIVRRLIGLLVPIVTINLGISLARFVSTHSDKSNLYFLQSFFIITLLNLFLGLLFFVFSREFARVIFGNNQFNDLLLPTIIFLYATSFQLICHSYFRGKHDFNRMNFVHILYWLIATGSLFCLFVNNDFKQFIINYFIIYSFLSFLINWFFIITDKSLNKNLIIDSKKCCNINNFFSNSRFFKYGINRLPHGFFLAGLFYLPIFVATNTLSLKAAAYMGIIVSIIRMLQMIVYPFNMIFLPKFSLYQSEKNHSKIQYYSQVVLDYFFTIPLVLGLLVYFLSKEVVLLWFGGKYEIVVSHLLLISPFLGLFLVYVLIRGILDGLYDYPFSNVITFGGISCALIISLLSYFFQWKLIGLSVSLLMGILFLGFSSIFILVRKQNLKILNIKNLVASAWFLLLFFILFIFKENIIIHNIYISITVKLFTSIIILLISFVIYKMVGYEWIEEVKLRLYKGSIK